MTHTNPSSPEQLQRTPSEVRLRSVTIRGGLAQADRTERLMGLNEPERQLTIPPIHQETAEPMVQTNVIRFPLEHTVEQAPQTVYTSDAEARIKDAREAIEGLNAAA